MKKRFRLLAGPNGSGKSTLKSLLEEKYSVNFYNFLNADEINAELRRTGAFLFPLTVSLSDFESYVRTSSYEESVKDALLKGTDVSEEGIVFKSRQAINSYTSALLTNFLQHAFINEGLSFSQETVFSHPSKIDALREAREHGFRTYLYFVCTSSPRLNAARVESRVASGGHDVPMDKIIARYGRSLANVKAALPFCSRAYFFDNSDEMKLVAEYEENQGIAFADPEDQRPVWFPEA